MKHLMLVCLLAMSAAAGAQTTTAAPTPAKSADEAKREAEEAKIRAKLDEARARLDKAARDVAEYSTQLGREAMGGEQGIRTITIDGDHRAVLGVQIDNASDKAGARVMHVSPGGAAEEAGIRDGDVIVSIDGKSIAGSSSAGQAVVDQMRSVKPDQKVKVRVLRDGKNKDFVVVARPMTFDRRVFTMRGPGMMGPGGGVGAMGPMGAMPMVQQFHAFFPGEFGGMELASLTPKLGAYFGTNEGVLVVQAPDKEDFKLEDGDVIQSIDGRKPDRRRACDANPAFLSLRRKGQSQCAAPAQAADARHHDARAPGVRRRSFLQCAGSRRFPRSRRCRLCQAEPAR